MRNISTLITIIAVIAMLSCSGRGSPVAPSTPNMTDASSSTHSGQHCLLGYWDVFVDAERSSFEIIPLRDPQMHFNIVQPVEHTWKDSYLDVDYITVLDPNNLALSLVLKHPYPQNLNYTGFDVRAIFISQAGVTFPATGVSVAYGNDVARLLNPDGYTSLFNPVDFPQSQDRPDVLKYIRGDLALGGPLSSTLNPYIAFAKDYMRRAFLSDYSERASVYLYLPDGPVHFGYAIDASWAPAYPGPITDPYNQFPIEANAMEPFRIEVVTGGRELLPEVGSTTLLGLEVYDWQGAQTIEKVEIEIPGLFEGTRELDYAANLGSWGHGYVGLIENELGAGYGTYPMVVRVTDTETDPNLGAVYGWDFDVIRIKKGWARMVSVYGRALDSDDAGNIFVVGEGGGDLDPGPAVDIHPAGGCLISYNSNADYQWGEVWYGDEAAYIFCSDVEVTEDSIYVLGTFSGRVDFDPGPGEDIKLNPDRAYAYLSKFSLDGTYQSVLRWGPCVAESVSISGDGDIYVTGYFSQQADFDPGYYGTFTEPFSSHDAFVLHLNADGSYDWVGHWGRAEGTGIATDTEGSGYVTGWYRDTVDFDPGSGVDERESNGYDDIFLSKFNSSGELIWADTWGGSAETGSGDLARAIAISDSDEIYVTGEFIEQADFDPGPGIEILISDASRDAFLSKFNTAGELIWARHWGGPGSKDGPATNIGIEMTIDNQANIIVAGYAGGDCDFDPGSGTAIIFEGYGDGMFVSKLTANGDYQWARFWEESQVFAVTADQNGSIYLSGILSWYYNDADPTEGVDYLDGGSFILKLTSDGEY